MADTYTPPAFTRTEGTLRENAAEALSTILIIVMFFASVAVACWLACRNSGGVKSCTPNGFTAKVVCYRG